MDPNDNSSCESSFCKDEKVEAMNLLEECWFFDNLLNIKPKMLRSHSDPYPSTRLIDSDFLVKDKSAFVQPKKIQRTPSMSPIRVKKEEEEDKIGSKLVHQPLDPSKQHHCAKMKGLHHRSDCNRRKSKLLRTPSLPPSLGREEKSQETYPRNGRSKKQPSTPTNIEKLPPRLTSKSCSIPRCRPSKNIEVESLNKEGIMEMRRKVLNQKTIRRSLSDLEYEEVQGFKDLGFSFEKEALSPSLANIIPGLQEKNRDESEEDKAARGPYLSEAWLVQSCATPPVPNWGDNMSADDMKKHIKFWARAVASTKC
ncbi:unnamed protein product [Vicia faba]|uniref:Uncharacterized protein n=1 Tax=Vicia faba TaxID=3906 RepID=A0AAV0Z706_VICFA|nr:unnamed protein product [Vicia faba]